MSRAGLLAAGGDLSAARLLAAYRSQHLSVVLARAAGAVVGAGSARGAFPEEFRCLAQPGKDAAQPRLSQPHRSGFPRRDRRLRGTARAPARAPGSPLTCKPPTPICTSAATPTASRPMRGEELVGGLYGVRLGGVFFGESMFSRERDASKIALAYLVRACLANDIAVIDCQLPSRHLEKSRQPADLARANFASLVRAHDASEALCRSGFRTKSIALPRWFMQNPRPHGKRRRDSVGR